MMSKTVYGIFTRYYSNWKCIGYCSSKDEAEKRVAKQNAENSLSGAYWNDEYVMDGKSNFVVRYVNGMESQIVKIVIQWTYKFE